MLDSLSEKVLAYINSNGNKELTTTEIIDAFSNEKSNLVKGSIWKLKRNDLINGFSADNDLLCISPTYDGSVYFEMKEKNNNMNQSGQTIFNIQQASNSIFGNQQQATINQTNVNFDSLKELVASKGEANNPEINELINLLQEHLEQNKPLEKGMLSKFGDVLIKHQWLSAPLGQTLVQALASLPIGI